MVLSYWAHYYFYSHDRFTLLPKVIGVSLTNSEDRKLPLISTSHFYSTAILWPASFKGPEEYEICTLYEELF